MRNHKRFISAGQMRGVGDETCWVSLQRNAEQGTMLTLNLSHSPLSSSLLGPCHSQPEYNYSSCSYT